MRSTRCYYCSGHAVDTCKEYLGEGKRCKRPLCSRHVNTEKGHTTCVGHAPQIQAARTTPWEEKCASQ